jgi:pyridoxine 4-dehydrogenase
MVLKKVMEGRIMADISAAQAGTVTFGTLTVNKLGLGTNRITDTEEAHSLLKRAVELGINFIDTAHVYAGGDSEVTIGKALSPYPEGLVIATKGGYEETSLQELEEQLHTSLERLKTDHIDLYQLHRVNPHIPLTEIMGQLKKFQTEGLIHNIGLSEVSLDQLKDALQVVAVDSVQNEYNVANRKHEALVDFCSEQDIAFIPWFPLGGLRGDTAKVEAKVADIAAKYDATAQQIALAWLLKRSPMMLPIPGTLSIEHMEDNLKAAAINLSNEDYDFLTRLD